MIPILIPGLLERSVGDSFPHGCGNGRLTLLYVAASEAVIVLGGAVHQTLRASALKNALHRWKSTRLLRQRIEANDALYALHFFYRSRKRVFYIIYILYTIYI